MNDNKKRLLKRGVGLIEVLIALVLISTSMILAIRTVSRGLKATKENEIRDRSVGVMLQALELNQIQLDAAGSPIDLVGLEDSTDSIQCYSSSSNGTTGGDFISSLVKQTCVVGNLELTSDSCDTGSNYYANLGEGLEICHQVILTTTQNDYISDLSPNNLRITSIVVYTIEGEKIRERIDTYRRI
ncbi:hypothetical protein KC717_05970 [Candidatus Dojkabacteria bacterium]|uniref:Uncharacterized protein n=1 Tax=Candidatus Dojkabacteria bacterium TaxID=2099670 RepID=A0A955L9K6_9BACT|nr:hypothetical protein [Candidatus Dojkabacteria bacterium]